MSVKRLIFRVGGDTREGDLTLDKLSEKLKKLTDRTYTAKVGADLKDSVKLREYAMQLDRIGKKVARAHVSTEGLDRANLAADRLLLKLDAIDHKSGSHFGKFGGNLLKAPFSGNALKGLLTGTPGTMGGLGSFLASPTGLGAIAGALSLLPSLLGAGAVLGVGGLGAGAGIMLGSKANQQLQQLAQRLSSGKGSAAKNAPILAQMAAIRKANAGELGLFGGFQDLGHSVLGVFSSALESNAPKPHGGTVPGTSFLAGMTGLFKQLAGFAATLGPELGSLFRAATPGLTAFIKGLEPAIRQMMPALTQVLKAMAPVMGQLGKAFGSLLVASTKALAGMSGAFHASAAVVTAVVHVIDRLLVYAGKVIGDLVVGFSDLIHGKWNAAWKAFRDIGVTAWHMLYGDFGHWFHAIASFFDNWRHQWAADWDNLWNNTVARVQRGVADVNSWFHRLPGSIMAALKGLGSTLWVWGKNLLQMIINGAKSMLSSIGGFFSGIGHTILKALGSLFHFGSPSKTMFKFGQWIVQGLEHGIQSRITHLRRASGAMGGAILGGSPGQAQRYAQSLLGRYGWSGQWGPLNAVAMRESGWRMNAQNPNSPAYGIAQFIQGPSEYYSWGGNPNTIAGQVTAFFNYIRGTYGSPARAWQHELNYGWYDTGGVLKRGLTLALNTTGHDEYIHTSPRGGEAPMVVQVTINGVLNGADAGREVTKALYKFKNTGGARVLAALTNGVHG